MLVFLLCVGLLSSRVPLLLLSVVVAIQVTLPGPCDDGPVDTVAHEVADRLLVAFEEPADRVRELAALATGLYLLGDPSEGGVDGGRLRCLDGRKQPFEVVLVARMKVHRVKLATIDEADVQ